MPDLLKEKRDQRYNESVKQVTPTHSLWKNCRRAFLVGGIICVIGQGITNGVMALGASQEDAATWCSIILILLSVILTGAGIYQPLAKYAGAGTLVPITGFANSVAAPAIEFQKDE